MSVIVTASTVPKNITSAIGQITVHGLLAAVLTLDASNNDQPSWQKWRAVWPTYQDFQQSHPLLWDPALQKLLPPAAEG